MIKSSDEDISATTNVVTPKHIWRERDVTYCCEDSRPGESRSVYCLDEQYGINGTYYVWVCCDYIPAIYNEKE